MSVGADGDHYTFCRICEAFCGMTATVKDGRIVRVTPDREQPHSQGHVCVKGVTFHQVTHDPDRVTRPLKRIGGPGEFIAVSWDEALDDIAGRLNAIIDRHGPEAIASYKGNPIAFSTDASMALIQFLDALGVKKYYGAGSQDTNARFAANYILFGNSTVFEVADTTSCDFLIIMGGNPLVSNGSMLNSPRIRHDLDAIAKRGRVLVVDPRYSETAKAFEHQPIHPNGDTWLLLSMLRTLIDEDLVDHALLDEHANGWPQLRDAVLALDLREAAAHTGIPVERMQDIARQFAATPRASIYGRLGICRGPFATLENFLVTAINMAAGKFGQPGGPNFPRRVLAAAKHTAPGGYDESRSRIGNFPSVARFQASAVMPDDLLAPGAGRVRALIATGGNVLLTAPGGGKLERGMDQLELMFSLDFYQNESNRYAHYILPTPTFFERDDVPLAGFSMMTRPFIQHTDAVIPPVEDARSEFDIFRDLLGRMGHDALARMPMRPMDAIDLALRNGPVGDSDGRPGWSFERLRENPHGVMLDIPPAYNDWERIAYDDRRIRLWHPLIEEEFRRLRHCEPATGRLKLISRRDIRSMNSWLHNVDRLVRAQLPTLQVNPTDAAARDVKDGDEARISNHYGEVLVVVEVTQDVMAGTICYPHGWGHNGGWQLANKQQGSNFNELLGTGPEVVEPVSGTTIMDGIEVDLYKPRKVRLTKPDSQHLSSQEGPQHVFQR